MKLKSIIFAAALLLPMSAIATNDGGNPQPQPQPVQPSTNVGVAASATGTGMGIANSDQSMNNKIGVENGNAIDVGVKANNTLFSDTASNAAVNKSGNSQIGDVKPTAFGGDAQANGGNVAGSGNAHLKDVGNAKSSAQANGGNLQVGDKALSPSATVNLGTGALSGGAGGTGGRGGESSANSTSNSRVTGTNSGTVNGTTGASRAVTGASTATGNGQGNTTNVGGTTSNIRYTYLPPIQAQSAPVHSTPSTIASDVMPCGPMMQIKKTGINGTELGIFSNTTIGLGENYELVPMVDKNGQEVFFVEKSFPDGTIGLFGHKSIIRTALVNVASSKSLTIGYVSSSGSGGNGGGGSAGTMNQLATVITQVPCLFNQYKVEVVPPVVVPPAPVALPSPPPPVSALVSATREIVVETEKVETRRVNCEKRWYTDDATGKKVFSCEGPNGYWLDKKVVPTTKRIQVNCTGVCTKQ